MNTKSNVSWLVFMKCRCDERSLRCVIPPCLCNCFRKCSKYLPLSHDLGMMKAMVPFSASSWRDLSMKSV